MIIYTKEDVSVEKKLFGTPFEIYSIPVRRKIITDK